ncbi:MAG: hypothetical protein OXI30_00775 [Chloroflexota bacterium]|nr:hypothetical protein [Chloroflexota bacterium]
MFRSKHEELFWDLYQCKTEQEVAKFICERPNIFAQSNWHPLGGNSDFFGVVENQQSNPVAALVEKLTNAIDAVLMRRCYEEGIDPKSAEAPRSIEEAVHRFFPEHSNWDLRDPRSDQARSIQILADGTRGNTSIVVYDDGEGQNPEKFEETFLSILQGNKRKIRFVQGRYNMGGTGAIVFCGRRRYQLIASKRYDGTGKFGFTLIRERPRRDEEYDEGSEYQYLLVDDKIPAFDIDELELGLHRRRFHTGTIIKLYSYDVHGNRHFIRDMSPSLNQYLFEPALPYAVVESELRYKRPHGGKSLVNYGLRRRLDNSDYLETSFSETITDRRFGTLKVSVYVFKARVEGKTAAATKETIRNEYFKNRMQVVFSVAGQVHGHYTSEFISRTLQFNVLKDYLLIHVDCTEMKHDFRRNLFKADRERMNQSKEAAELRKKLGDSLKSGRLKEINKQRRNRLSLDSVDEDSLLKEIAEDLTFDKDMQELIKQTLELDAKSKRKKPKPPQPRPPREPFEGKRYPSFFSIDTKKHGVTAVIHIPHGDSKSVQFDSDVENHYFDRAHDPGALELAVMTYTPNDASGGDKQGTVNDISEIFSVTRRSPQDGKIRVVFEPTKDVQVGDEVEIRADLLSSAEPSGARSVRFWVMITEPQPKKQPKPKLPPKEDKLGLPKPVKVFEQATDAGNVRTWDDIEQSGITMNHGVVMHPDVEAGKLEAIYINMDSSILKNYRAKERNISEEKSRYADRQYISRVYYHTLFLYAINKGRNYVISQANGDHQAGDIDLSDYLKDVFDSNYAEFLLNFETSALLEGLG